MSGVKQKSLKKEPDQVLGVIYRKDITAFLMDSANLPNPIDHPDHHAQFHRWLRNWQRLFTFRTKAQNGKPRTALIPKKQLEELAPNIRTALRRIWHEKDPRQRDWYLFRLRVEHHRMVVQAESPGMFDITHPDAPEQLLELDRVSKARGDDPGQRFQFFKSWTGADIVEDEVPRICPLEAAIYWLQINQNLIVYCEGPLCPAPYFLRKPEQKGQKYCSPECADPARREAKLKWWNENRKGK